MTSEPSLGYGSAAGRWVIFATVLGSGMAFLDSTVINVALPAIAGEFDVSISGLQWTVDAYLLTLSALLLLGGSLGDLFGRRRMFLVGLGGFTIASALCGVAPSLELLVAARALQGVGAALLVPGSLAIISTVFAQEGRGQAIGAWSGLSGVTTALGPLLGGWLVDAVSWRLVFFINLPLGALAFLVTLRHVPETRSEEAGTRPDLPGAVTATVGLGAIIYALIEGQVRGWGNPLILVALVVGGMSLAAFFRVESVRSNPMLPLPIFRSRQFVGANLTTLAVYGALGGALFLLVLQLQSVVGYSALEAGGALTPITLALLLLSPSAGKLAKSIGARIPMTAGPAVAGVGLALLAGVDSGSTYATGVLPGVVVFGLGLALTVAPLTTAVLAAVPSRRAGIASGINNAVARLAGLLAVALLPLAAGISSTSEAGSAGFSEAFARAMLISAGLCWLGAVSSWVMIRRDRAPGTPPPASNQATPAHSESRRSP